ncbi:MAG: nuclear transport factor 2 family protein [Sphingobacteriia bacterium]|nr:nuclear transport factor 2 family protein [Sphingobacteriia bacterium]
MNNKELIEKFYTAFQKLDYTAMQSCYAANVVFNDPVFGILQNGEPQAMWEMLCKRATDFSLTFSNIELLDEEYATCNWTATYLFGPRKRKVINNIKAHFRIQNGLITEHTDQFNLYNWSKQALGLSGVLFGWASFFQTRIKRKALGGLWKFMNH